MGPRFRVVFVEHRLKPVGTISDPPGGHTARDCGGDGPPKGQGEVGDEAEGGEGQPKNFALHEFSLAERMRTGVTANNDCARLRSEQKRKGRELTRPSFGNPSFSNAVFVWFSE